MSTRAQIQVKGSPILIYKHCDGYPEGVLPTLEPFAKAFTADRGNDVDYCLAQIVRSFACQDAYENGKYTPLNGYFTGWGLDQIVHGDIEFFYVVDADTGTVEIHDKDFDAVYARNKG